jgi:hypothetical protein
MGWKTSPLSRTAARTVVVDALFDNKNRSLSHTYWAVVVQRLLTAVVTSHSFMFAVQAAGHLRSVFALWGEAIWRAGTCHLAG